MYDERERAFAVIMDEKIDVRTVSETRRAAIVNWLVVSCGCPVFNFTTDEEIERLWRGHSEGAAVGRVEINRALPEI